MSTLLANLLHKRGLVSLLFERESR